MASDGSFHHASLGREYFREALESVHLPLWMGENSLGHCLGTPSGKNRREFAL